jgi:dTDP-4-amino-4,6-dideoxygalactose transaminase
LPVHLYGRPAPMDELLTIASKHGLVVISDAAQSFGSRYHGRRTSSLGAGSAVSFYPGKNLGGLGDAGAVLTNSLEIADSVRMLRNYGSVEKNVHHTDGWNSRLSELQAAVLAAKLGHLDRWNTQRTQLAHIYEGKLSGAQLLRPSVDVGIESVWHLYVVRVSNRNMVLSALRSEGIEAMIHYPIPIHRQAAFHEFRNAHLPVADALAHTVISLPIGPHLAVDQVEFVASTVTRIVGACQE